VFVVVVLVPYGTLSDSNLAVSATLLGFLAALPLVNAVFDWLSLGLTRYLLARTARGAQPLLNGALDIAGAAIILFSLAVATTAALQGLNTLAFASGSDRPLIDLPFILETLREQPGDPAVWWVYFMLFSTLIPSVIHLFIAASSFITWTLPKPWLARHRAALEAGFDGHPQAQARTALTMTVRQFASLGALALALAAIIGVGFGLTNIVPQFGMALLWVAEHTAAALYAPITPGPAPWE